MDRYKVLLVDDEELARRAIACKLDWEALGFCVVGEAANGEEALELCEQLEPDVIMTDIKMPFMDGLTLCRRAKQLLPSVRVAIFSGFDEFEYAKEAIRLEVEEYILKPIDAEELAEVFRRIRTSLDEEIAQSRDMERLRRYYEQSLPLMRQQLLTALLEGRMESHRIQGALQSYELDLAAPGYCVASLRPRPAEQQSNPLLTVSLRQMIGEILPPALRYENVSLPDREILIFLLAQGQEVRTIISRLAPLFPAVQKRLGLGLSIGVSNQVEHIEQLALAYGEAQNALEYQALVESGQCIFIGDIEPVAADPGGWDTQNVEAILRQIKVGSRQDLQQAVDEAVLHFKKRQPSLQQYQFFILNIAFELLKVIKAYRLQEEQQLGNALLEKSLSQFSSLDEMGHWLFEYCDTIRSMIRTERKDSTKMLIEKAAAYIQNHYADSELSADNLSCQLNVSPAYFSTLFKKETGCGFVGYLTNLRMEKALEYLNTSDDKTYQIAEKIGYTDPNYFSYVFKKQFGVSPSKYRTNRMSHHETGQENSG